MVTSYAVVGASRGIGLEYVRQLAARPDTLVFAIVRNGRTSTHLAAAAAGLKNVHILDADVAIHASLEHAAKQVSEITGGSLDYLIHNAARMDIATIYKGFDSFDDMEQLDADFMEAYKVNALGVVHSIHAFVPLLRKSSTKKIVVIASEGGQADFVLQLGLAEMPAYGMSKAASIIAATKWAVKLAPEGFTVVNLSPGLVDTRETYDMSPAAKEAIPLEQFLEVFINKGFNVRLLKPAQSVEIQLKTIDGLTTADNGKFISPTHGA